MLQGAIINDDIEEMRRKIPPNQKIVKPGEPITLQYQVSWYQEKRQFTDGIVILSLGMQQISVNTQPYLKFKLENGKIIKGIITINAPLEPGDYELTGWYVDEPFKNERHDLMPLQEIYRFTIRVEE